jgi:hypothetical protein
MKQFKKAGFAFLFYCYHFIWGLVLHNQYAVKRILTRLRSKSQQKKQKQKQQKPPSKSNNEGALPCPA